MSTLTIIIIYYWFSTFYCLGRKIDVDDDNITFLDVVMILTLSWFYFPLVLGFKYK